MVALIQNKVILTKLLMDNVDIAALMLEQQIQVHVYSIYFNIFNYYIIFNFREIPTLSGDPTFLYLIN